jgi:8-oxo-dGTP pyrophosphatase MutT (NUDIX family)
VKNGAIGIIFNQDRSEILLVRRRDVPVWVLPGGGIEEGEAPEVACLREVFEETGLHVRIRRRVGEYIPLNWMASHATVFECEPLETIEKTLPPQHESLFVAFWNLEKLPKNLFFLHQEWINDARRNAPEPIVRYMTSLTWRALLKNIFIHPVLLLRALLARVGLPINSKSP